ncbi:unnamed protein product [Amoebophrya sp. A25]|nr:unnamed protein product [Amoebophrya sp. A25]|eukprot:GSA25T00025998001.1
MNLRRPHKLQSKSCTAEPDACSAMRKVELPSMNLNSTACSSSPSSGSSCLSAASSSRHVAPPGRPVRCGRTFSIISQTSASLTKMSAFRMSAFKLTPVHSFVPSTSPLQHTCHSIQARLVLQQPHHSHVQANSALSTASPLLQPQLIHHKQTSTLQQPHHSHVQANLSASPLLQYHKQNHYKQTSTSLQIQIRLFSRCQRIDRLRIERKWRAEKMVHRWKSPDVHYGMLNKLRLTRFGWQYRAQGAHASDRRRLDQGAVKRRRMLRYLERSEMRIVRRACPTLTLRFRDPPIDHNPNAKQCRQIINRFFG